VNSIKTNHRKLYKNSKLFILIMSLLFAFTLQNECKDKKMTGTFYVRADAPPWSMSILSPDTGKLYFPTVKPEELDSIKLLLFRDYSRFAPDGKGENYLKVEGHINSDGTFEFDLSEFKEGDLISVVALNKGYIKLWHSFRFCEKCNYKNMKIVFVKIRSKQTH